MCEEGEDRTHTGMEELWSLEGLPGVQVWPRPRLAPCRPADWGPMSSHRLIALGRQHVSHPAGQQVNTQPRGSKDTHCIPTGDSPGDPWHSRSLWGWGQRGLANSGPEDRQRGQGEPRNGPRAGASGIVAQGSQVRPDSRSEPSQGGTFKAGLAIAQ